MFGLVLFGLLYIENSTSSIWNILSVSSTYTNGATKDILSVSDSHTNGATLPVSQLEQGGALAPLKF